MKDKRPSTARATRARKLAAAVMFALGVLAWHADAHAACVSTTFIQDGRVIFCQQCCYGNQCTVHCF